MVTVLNGLSTQARDGADRAELLAVTDAAMFSGERLAGRPSARAARSEPAATG